MNFVKPVKSVKIRRVRDPVYGVCVYLYHTRNIIGLSMRNDLLEHGIPDILYQQIGNKKLGVRKFIVFLRQINAQAFQHARQAAITLRYCFQIFFVNVNAINRIILVCADMLKPVPPATPRIIAVSAGYASSCFLIREFSD